MNEQDELILDEEFALDDPSLTIDDTPSGL